MISASNEYQSSDHKVSPSYNSGYHLESVGVYDNQIIMMKELFVREQVHYHQPISVMGFDNLALSWTTKHMVLSFNMRWAGSSHPDAPAVVLYITENDLLLFFYNQQFSVDQNQYPWTKIYKLIKNAENASQFIIHIWRQDKKAFHS